MTEKPFVLDDVDRHIIRALQKNGRASSGTIGRSVNVSDATVRFRLNRLLKKGIIRLTAALNPFAFENALIALVGMKLEKRTHETTMAKISQIPGVVSVCNATGSYDLFVEVFFESREDLRRFLVEDMGRVGGINSSETFIFLDAINKWTELT